MHKTIALFNHKGGVSKTTTTFNLSWMLAEKGFRVVMVDTDPQCNLTGLVMDYSQSIDLDNFYTTFPQQNIKAALAPAYESQPMLIDAIDCVEVPTRNGLFLVPGHINFSEYEVTLGVAQELSSSIQALRNVPGAFHYFINKVAKKYDADFVLIDMSPSLSSMNQNILVTSDYFLIPTAPDYFSVMAIESLATTLPKWVAWAHKAANSETLKTATYPFPDTKLKFIGTVIQRYRQRKKKPTVGFQNWFSEINTKVKGRLVPSLSQTQLLLDAATYENNTIKDTAYCLAQIPDFNTLITASQTHQTPVFALTDDMIGHTGVVLEQDINKKEEFHSIFSELATRIIGIVKDGESSLTI
ncbi:MAG: hypothetical protein A2600_03635 [Candidatus Lambdaproteobacteria bacterium RIFOXYD1_FULL_56_27]|uniref:AAA domain-containing protein n=1 Tax=Candidatus Lambdaproteobacteria bacterium RIFOXYD2_FULL_56_26 TaxID=1817773 RepID=A0A1F6H387_9PROT|nr:MAG: hypothetical protein A2426_11695 [Candidatus Lambdaproteobacteria bacterium RIFOXYC1_FULL_56_13]OGH04857.1 MAG: hypothetical protein A2557_07700 [Candidatus Lambdaproteobacteria bacterium RIFOXYD2_FULL_56_26]OGH09322.1 MAG: hypothetical protein A2600_03635 [Candidatus Lambdaproteobacteria bacterium RIFOXYD1_FULL_56_27]